MMQVWAMAFVPILMGAMVIGALGAIRTVKPRPGLKAYERLMLDPYTFCNMGSPSRLKTEKRKTATSSSPVLASVDEGTHLRQLHDSGTSISALIAHLILQPLVRIAYQLTGLNLLLMANQDYKDTMGPCIYPTTHTTAANKRPAVDSPVGVNEAFPMEFPEQGWSEDEYEEDDDHEEEIRSDITEPSEGEEAQEQETVFEECGNSMLLSGLQFYAVVSQVTNSVTAFVVEQGTKQAAEKIVCTRKNQSHAASLSVIEAQYPDFVCLHDPTSTYSMSDLASTLKFARVKPFTTEGKAPLKLPAPLLANAVGDGDNRLRMRTMPSSTILTSPRSSAA